MTDEEKMFKAEREWLDKAAADSLRLSVEEYLGVDTNPTESEYDPDEDRSNHLGEFE